MPPKTMIETLAWTCSIWFARVGGALIVLIAVLVSGDVVARNLINQTVFNSFEISIYLFGAAVTFGFAHTALTGAHIRIDVIYRLFPVAVRRVLDSLALLNLAALAMFFAFHAWSLALDNLGRGVMSNSALAVPLYIPQMAWALGLTAFTLSAILLTVQHGMLLSRRAFDEADRIAGLSSAAEEAGSEVAEASGQGRG
ncbi:TRAP transporter small permease subunit [Oceanibacterium hippocampi]|uniref:TRAP transporter small permease protein n=1 Tax=Oceanibacterium hippocampi TaxID=745714 RepID=A0A1Y5U255_9PROT|nr:TRAP transporter small permease [Oceanibacterium hippocampi]SLN75339.1 Tripartite ATP-independent periplasmic transporters, DctQ component [Oceanibacterium hippocampi]